MSEPALFHRLDGIEPDNLLAFLALLGLLRALEEAKPDWRPRAGWDLRDDAPLRPFIVLREAVTPEALCEAAAQGIAALAGQHDFGGKADLNHTRKEARDALEAARDSGGYAADLAAALMSDAAVKEAKDQIEATPLCLLFGQGHQHFLDRLAAVPRTPAPPPRGRGRKAIQITATECLAEALFAPWARPDPTFSFRWDPAEDVRYALMADDPSSLKGLTQHGANRLAAVGLSTLPAVPVTARERVRPLVPGGRWPRGGFTFAWPIWAEPISLAAVIALLNHPRLRDADVREALGVDHVREVRRHSVGKFMNLSTGRPVEAG